MANENILVLNDFGLTQRTRISASGTAKDRYSVQIDAEPLAVNLDPRSLGKPVADAIAKLFRDRITGIGAPVAAATAKARKVAAKALALGKPWATKRYAGGRIGQLNPAADGGTLFNDSGRLARSIAVGSNDDEWTVNVAANRLNPDTLDHGGTNALRAIFDRLRDFLPEIGDGDALMSAIPVRRAIEDTVERMFKKLEMGASDAALQVATRVFELVQQADDALASDAG